MPTQRSSSRHNKQKVATVALLAVALSAESLLAGAVLRTGGVVPVLCALIATGAAVWLFVLLVSSQLISRAKPERTLVADVASLRDELEASSTRKRSAREGSASLLSVKSFSEQVRRVSPANMMSEAPPSSEPAPVASQQRIRLRSESEAGSIRVLVVDDEELVLRSTARMLENRGYSVLTARDYAEALSLAQGELNLALVVTDVALAGISGKEVVRGLRSVHPALKVVYVSGYDVATSGIHLASDGSEEFLAKPFAPAVLDQRLKSLLGLDLVLEPMSLGA